MKTVEQLVAELTDAEAVALYELLSDRLGEEPDDMQCERCHGKGRVVDQVTFYHSGQPDTTVLEIGLCPICHGIGSISCCEGSESDLAPLERVADTMPCDCNPNEAS